MLDENSEKSDHELLGLMTGAVAHDLNNFLSPILLGVQTLQRNEPDDKTKRILSMIELSSRRAADLIRHLLDYSRRFHATGQSTSIQSVREAAARFAIENPTLRIEITLSEGLEATHIAMDAALLSKMISSILYNAVDAAGLGSPIRMELSNIVVDDEYKRSHRLARTGDYVCISIQDNGSGISADDLKHVCEAFFTTRRDAHHAGIGLFLVNTLIKQSEGFLELESEVGKGTTVKMFIPADKTASHQ